MPSSRRRISSILVLTTYAVVVTVAAGAFVAKRDRDRIAYETRLAFRALEQVSLQLGSRWHEQEAFFRYSPIAIDSWLAGRFGCATANAPSSGRPIDADGSCRRLYRPDPANAERLYRLMVALDRVLDANASLLSAEVCADPHSAACVLRLDEFRAAISEICQADSPLRRDLQGSKVEEYRKLFDEVTKAVGHARACRRAMPSDAWGDRARYGQRLLTSVLGRSIYVRQLRATDRYASLELLDPIQIPKAPTTGTRMTYAFEPDAKGWRVVYSWFQDDVVLEQENAPLRVSFVHRASVSLGDQIRNEAADRVFDAMFMTDTDGKVLHHGGDESVRVESVRVLQRGDPRGDLVDRALALVDSDGSDEGGVGSDRAGAADGRPGGGAEWSRHLVLNASTPDSSRVRIGPVSYHAFVLPFTLPYPVTGKADDDGVYHLVGLIEEDNFRDRAARVPLTVWLLLFLAVSLGFLALPWLRIRLIDSHQPIRVSETYALAGSLIFGSGILTLAAMTTLSYFSLAHRQDRIADEISAEIRASFRAELDQMLGVRLPGSVARWVDQTSVGHRRLIQERTDIPGAPFTMFDAPFDFRTLADHDATPAEQNRAKEATRDHMKALEAKSLCEPVRPMLVVDHDSHRFTASETSGLASYPDYEFMAFLDGAGRLVGPMFSAREVATYPAPVQDRVYFRRALNGPRFRLTGNDASEAARSRGFFVERIATRDHSLKLSALAIPLEHFALPIPCEARVVLAIKRFRTFWKPVLPLGYRFAVVESGTGRVLYHSDDERSLSENFFDEADQDGRTRSLIEGRESGITVARYHGRSQRLHVAPIRDLPWSLVVLFENEYVEATLFNFSWTGLLLYLIYAAVVVAAVASVRAVVGARAWAWIWPQPAHARQYTMLTALSLAAAIVFLMSIVFLRGRAIVLPVLGVPLLVAGTHLLALRPRLDRGSRFFVVGSTALGAGIALTVLAALWMGPLAGSIHFPWPWAWIWIAAAVSVLGLVWTLLVGRERSEPVLTGARFERRHETTIGAFVLVVGALPSLAIYLDGIDLHFNRFVFRNQLAVADRVQDRLRALVLDAHRLQPTRVAPDGTLTFPDTKAEDPADRPNVRRIVGFGDPGVVDSRSAPGLLPIGEVYRPLRETRRTAGAIASVVHEGLLAGPFVSNVIDDWQLPPVCVAGRRTHTTEPPVLTIPATECAATVEAAPTGRLRDDLLVLDPHAIGRAREVLPINLEWSAPRVQARLLRDSSGYPSWITSRFVFSMSRISDELSRTRSPAPDHREWAWIRGVQCRDHGTPAPAAARAAGLAALSASRTLPDAFYLCRAGRAPAPPLVVQSTGAGPPWPRTPSQLAAWLVMFVAGVCAVRWALRLMSRRVFGCDVFDWSSDHGREAECDPEWTDRPSADETSGFPCPPRPLDDPATMLRRNVMFVRPPPEFLDTLDEDLLAWGYRLSAPTGSGLRHPNRGPGDLEQRVGAGWYERASHDASGLPDRVLLVRDIAPMMLEEGGRLELLQFLERALSDPDLRVLVGASSTVFRRLVDTEPLADDAEQGPPSGDAESYRWSRIQARLVKLRLPLPWSPEVDDAVHDAPSEAMATLIRETHWSWSLRWVFDELAPRLTEPGPGALSSPEASEVVVQWVKDRADPIFRQEWAFCTPPERLALVQLARHGLLNPYDARRVRRLLRAGLVRRTPGFQIASEALRRFILTAESPERIARWEGTYTGHDTWSAVRVPAFFILGGLAAFAAYAGEHTFERMIALLPAIGASIPLLMRFVSPARLASNPTPTDAAQA